MLALGTPFEFEGVLYAEQVLDPWLKGTGPPHADAGVADASTISPAAVRRSTRSLLDRAQVPRGRRGENHCSVRSASSLTTFESIQPKQSASSTDET